MQPFIQSSQSCASLCLHPGVTLILNLNGYRMNLKSFNPQHSLFLFMALLSAHLCISQYYREVTEFLLFTNSRTVARMSKFSLSSFKKKKTAGCLNCDFIFGQLVNFGFKYTVCLNILRSYAYSHFCFLNMKECSRNETAFHSVSEYWSDFSWWFGR